jgi:hypothetical protein
MVDFQVASARPHRPEAQDVALSRPKHGFESRWGRHSLTARFLHTWRKQPRLIRDLVFGPLWPFLWPRANVTRPNHSTLLWAQGVAGSKPVAPTTFQPSGVTPG